MKNFSDEVKELLGFVPQFCFIVVQFLFDDICFIGSPEKFFTSSFKSHSVVLSHEGSGANFNVPLLFLDLSPIFFNKDVNSSQDVYFYFDEESYVFINVSEGDHDHTHIKSGAGDAFSVFAHDRRVFASRKPFGDVCKDCINVINARIHDSEVASWSSGDINVFCSLFFSYH